MLDIRKVRYEMSVLQEEGGVGQSTPGFQRHPYWQCHSLQKRRVQGLQSRSNRDQIGSVFNPCNICGKGKLWNFKSRRELSDGCSLT